MNFPCPLPVALSAIPVSACPFRLDQLVRLAIRRRGNAAFASSTTIQTLATWTPLLAGTDDTKIVMSPIFAGLVIPASEGQFVGGNDNTTFNGIREYYGENFVTVTGTFRNPGPATLKAMDELAAESAASSVGLSNLEVFPFNKDQFGFADNLDGIMVYNFRVASRGSEGLNTPDIVPFSFDLPAYWDRNLVSFKPVFNPLTDLQNV